VRKPDRQAETEHVQVCTGRLYEIQLVYVAHGRFLRAF
jgi:hypothetical protein